MEGRDQQAPPVGWQPPGQPSVPQDLVEGMTLGLPLLLRKCESAVPSASPLRWPGKGLQHSPRTRFSPQAQLLQQGDRERRRAAHLDALLNSRHNTVTVFTSIKPIGASSHLPSVTGVSCPLWGHLGIEPLKKPKGPEPVHVFGFLAIDFGSHTPSVPAAWVLTPTVSPSAGGVAAKAKQQNESVGVWGRSRALSRPRAVQARAPRLR